MGFVDGIRRAWIRRDRAAAAGRHMQPLRRIPSTSPTTVRTGQLDWREMQTEEF